MQINVIIVEDEVHSAGMLKEMILSLRPEWNVMAILQSVSETVEWLKENTENIVIFLDIELADGNSFSIFEQMKVEHPVIFTTAYNEFALKAFQLNSIDYLLKPIKESELLKSIEKFERAIELFETNVVQSDKSVDYQQLAKNIMSASGGYRKRFLISKRDSFFKLPVEDIAYFYFESRVTFAVSFDGKQHIINQALDKLEEELDPQMFFRTNRQSIVNIEAIDHFEAYFSGKLVVKLVNKLNDKIMISRGKAVQFKDWVNQ
ncbi:LytR/AlgR family response regulator transcription factor [Carboxylicivirga linearis]|uniref:Response regulator transcription factor n=1 Tax=Carboxylicivirga linearis TaxID=1628157 RepID=A0ABS5JYI1_9BACT|nr:LytTR family DNA-binding domain-containing protein [Carboxylicivirga linearis]MBS2099860.1 response regulator transcription factor [Carboxylicivirga linearis]